MRYFLNTFSEETFMTSHDDHHSLYKSKYEIGCESEENLSFISFIILIEIKLILIRCYFSFFDVSLVYLVTISY